MSGMSSRQLWRRRSPRSFFLREGCSVSACMFPCDSGLAAVRAIPVAVETRLHRCTDISASMFWPSVSSWSLTCVPAGADVLPGGCWQVSELRAASRVSWRASRPWPRPEWCRIQCGGRGEERSLSAHRCRRTLAAAGSGPPCLLAGSRSDLSAQVCIIGWRVVRRISLWQVYVD